MTGRRRVSGSAGKTRRNALRAGVVTAAAAALLTGLAVPAHADHDVRIGGIGNVDLRVGEGPRDIEIRVENRNGGGNHNNPVDGSIQGVQVTMTVPLTDIGVHIASAPPECNRSNNNTRMDCTIDQIQAGETRSLRAQIGVHGNSPLQPGESRNGAAQVSLSTGAQQQFNVRVQGPDQPPAVQEISGFVTDELTGDGIADARVTLVDSQQVEHTTDTNDEGQYRFGPEEQIPPGSMALKASKDGYEGQSTTEDAQAGESVTGLQLTLRNTETPSPSPEPAESPEATASPTPVVAAEPTSGSSGPTFFTTVMIILGVLFLLLGIGAVVLLVLKRRRDRREEEGDGPTGAGVPGGPDPDSPLGPGSRGVYHPSETQVMGPRGGPLPAVGPQSALANAATTMMSPQGAGAAETTMLPRVDDPPGPRPPAPGGPPTRAFDPGQAHDGAGYDGAWRGQGAPDRYDHPTQLGQAYGSPAGQAYDGPGYEGRGGPGYEAPGYEGRGAPGYDGAGGSGYRPPGDPTYGGQPSPTYGGQPSPTYGGQASPTYGGQASPTYGGQASPTYGGQPSPTYGGQASPTYGSPGSPAAYGSPAAPQPSPGHHDPGGYGSAYDGGSYGPDPYTRAGAAGGHASPQPPQPPQPAGGYPHQAGQYDRSGYREPDYGQGDYRQSNYQPSGYGQPSYQDPGYDQSGYRGYYDQSGGPAAGHTEQAPRHSEPTSRHAEPAERRRLDWLYD